MEKKYSEHFLMDKETVLDYVRENLDFFDENAKLSAGEIGDGNINYVFQVREEGTGKSLVVKQADKLLRSSGRPLDLKRNKIEAEILRIQGNLVPSFVPKIYDYNEEMYALSMEDISAYKNMRKELMEGKIFPFFADAVTDFLVNTLLPTTDLIMDRHEKKKKVAEFINIELCDISEDLVFTEPYYDYKGRNIITKGMENFVMENLYEDEGLKAEVGFLRNHFMNHAEALIHGDLHSGSIFINQDGMKVIDPEFAFYGPMGYDIGNVIGNLLFAWANKAILSKETEFLAWIENTVSDIFDLFRKKALKKLKETVVFPLYNEAFQVQYVNRVLEDTLGYAGTEMIRRTVGDAKVMEVSSVEEGEKKVRLEKLILFIGIDFIKNRKCYREGKELICVLRKASKRI